MKRLCPFLIVIISCFLSAQEQYDIPWHSLANTTWPMIHANPQSNGRANVIGPETLDTLWIMDFSYGIFSGPVIGYDKNLYFGSYYWFDDHFYSVAKEGKINWSYSSGSGKTAHGGVVIGADSTIYYGADDGFLYALNFDGSLKWKYNSGNVIDPQIIINIDKEGTLYFTNGSGNLNAVKKNGTLKWFKTYDEGFRLNSPSFSPDGTTLYIAGLNKDLYAIDTSGSLKWKFNCGEISHIPVVDFQGNIYVINGGDTTKISSINNMGSLNWKFVTVVPDFQSNSAPTIDYEGNIYFFNYDSSSTAKRSVRSLDYYGNERWNFPLYLDNQYTEEIWQPLICDRKGNIFFGSTSGYYYYALNNNGELLWRMTLAFDQHQIDNTSALGEDGTLYFGSHKVKLFNNSYQNLFAIGSEGTTEVNETDPEINYSLYQNYPNPFNPTTKIKYSIPTSPPIPLQMERGRGEFVTVKIYNILGNEVAVLVSEEKEAGEFELLFDASQYNLSSGVYFYTLSAGVFRETKKMVLLR